MIGPPPLIHGSRDAASVECENSNFALYTLRDSTPSALALQVTFNKNTGPSDLGIWLLRMSRLKWTWVYMSCTRSNHVESTKLVFICQSWHSYIFLIRKLQWRWPKAHDGLSYCFREFTIAIWIWAPRPTRMPPTCLGMAELQQGIRGNTKKNILEILIMGISLW